MNINHYTVVFGYTKLFYHVRSGSGSHTVVPGVLVFSVCVVK